MQPGSRWVEAIIPVLLLFELLFIYIVMSSYSISSAIIPSLWGIKLSCIAVNDQQMSCKKYTVAILKFHLRHARMLGLL